MAQEKKHTILCVDDEKDNVEALERLFRKKHRVLKATSGAEALKILKGEEVSLIISDQRMPEMTGVELLSESLTTHPDTIRILLTGYTDIDSVIQAINTGQIYRYITKPWDPRDLEITIDRALERFELRSELKNKNEELRKAFDELRTLDEAKSHFMILINHELKTPLTTLLSYTELLKESQLDEEQKLFLKRIDSSAKRLQDIIFDVLEFVSADSGLTRLEAKRQKVAPLFEKLADSFKSQAQKKKQKIQIKTASQDLVFDSSIITNVLNRLMANAIKFADAETAIEIAQTEVDSQHDRISIKNSGQALNPNTIEKILKPFSLDENIMNHSKGIGMGLSISQALLKLHGSQLNFEVDGKNTTVSFLIEK